MRIVTRLRRCLSTLLCASLLGSSAVDAAPAGEWTGTDEQKIVGLSTIWAEAKYGFPSFDALPGLDWDRSYADFLPRVLEARDLEEYYLVLMEFAALLEDGHTFVLPPWGYMRPDFDNPPLEVQVVEGRFVVAIAGESRELAEKGIVPGLVITEVDGVEVRSFLEERINRYHPRGSEHANEALNVLYLLRGPRDSVVELRVEDESGAQRAVALTRNATMEDGRTFVPRALSGMAGGPSVETRVLEGDVAYARVAGFEDPGMVGAFLALVDEAVEFDLPGLIVDLRFSLGGRSDLAEKMIGALIDEPVSSPHWRYPHHVPARSNWGMPREWSTSNRMIEPRDGPRFLGPVVVLTAGTASSTAEDFAISLRYGKRALLVGERTAGSAGNPSHHPLPGGGELQMATFRAYLPDGGEYVGLGVQPDVEVAPTRESIRRGIDLVLESGRAVLADWNPYEK